MHGLPLDTEAGPPLGLPLRFFLVGLVFLLAATLLGVVDAMGLAPGLASIAHVHLLVAGWACLTILGAMTQFVPTWSGGVLRHARLVNVAFYLVALGITGLVLGFSAEAMSLLPLFGTLAATGFWLFMLAMGRTLLDVRPWDTTEAHFALALAYLALVPLFGLLLALDFTTGLLKTGSLTHSGVLGAHATLAVFGIVLTTILGALVQLATMFTQTELTGIDLPLLRIEQTAYPLGVVLLASGRLFSSPLPARVGIGLLGAGLVAFAVVLTRRLVGATVDYTPMHSRYGIVAIAFVAWVALAAPRIFASPLRRVYLFGGTGGRTVLLVGVVVFTILGTLYHVIPFLVWLDRYADRVGLEPVPAIDDLYVGSLATLDFTLTTSGLVAMVAGELLATPQVRLVGTGLFFTGVLVAVANMVGVVVRHRIRSPAESTRAPHADD